MKIDNQKLANWIRSVRGYQSQREFAKALGVSYTSVQFWERGKHVPDLESFEKLAEMAGMPLWELIQRMWTGELLSPFETALSQVDKLSREEQGRLAKVLIAELAEGNA